MSSPAGVADEAEAPRERPWYAAYPVARCEPKPITAAEVLSILKSDGQPGPSVVLVDLRRIDHEVSRARTTRLTVPRKIVGSRWGCVDVR
jgi:hypothetical protein